MFFYSTRLDFMKYHSFTSRDLIRQLWTSSAETFDSYGSFFSKVFFLKVTFSIRKCLFVLHFSFCWWHSLTLSWVVLWMTIRIVRLLSLCYEIILFSWLLSNPWSYLLCSTSCPETFATCFAISCIMFHVWEIMLDFYESVSDNCFISSLWRHQL